MPYILPPYICLQLRQTVSTLCVRTVALIFAHVGVSARRLLPPYYVGTSLATSAYGPALLLSRPPMSSAPTCGTTVVLESPAEGDDAHDV